MLRNLKDMVGFAIEATDGALGQILDFYFDDEAWVIRYLVIATGSWLSNRKVLISPHSIGEPNWSAEELPARLTRGRVREFPAVDTDTLVSRPYQPDFGAGYTHGDPHLRSANAVIGYHIQGTDGGIGDVRGMLVDQKSWAVRYLVINTGDWWLGREVLVAPESITDVSWLERRATIDLTRLALRESPLWDPAPQSGRWGYETPASLVTRSDTGPARTHS